MTDKEMVLLEGVIRKILVDIINRRQDTYKDLKVIIKNVSDGQFGDKKKCVDVEEIDLEFELYDLLNKIKFSNKAFNGYMII